MGKRITLSNRQCFILEQILNYMCDCAKISGNLRAEHLVEIAKSELREIKAKLKLEYLDDLR